MEMDNSIEKIRQVVEDGNEHVRKLLLDIQERGNPIIYHVRHRDGSVDEVTVKVQVHKVLSSVPSISDLLNQNDNEQPK